jgi:hypothetical protein
MVDGFQLDRVDVGEVTLRVRYGGEGEPVVLLHGHPRTHTTWHRVAPQLTGSFFVVFPDLRLRPVHAAAGRTRACALVQAGDGRRCRGGHAVPRPQVPVVQRQVKAPQLSRGDRAVLAGLARLLPAGHLRQLRLVISPRALLRWHAHLVQRRWTYPRRAPGQSRIAHGVRALILEMARDNPGWGYLRIHGELTGPGHAIATSTVWQILKDAGIDPGPRRSGQSRRAFLEVQAKTILAVDFFHVGTVFLCCSPSTTPGECTWPGSPCTRPVSG